MSTTRSVRGPMVRRGRWAAAAPLLALLACSDGGDAGDDAGAAASSTTGAAAPATIPEDVEPGRGYLLLDGELAVLTVSGCTLEPATDPTTGVTTELTAAAADATGRTIDVVRSSFTADLPTVTDTVTVTEGDVVLESSRADRDGLQIDLRLENPVGRLLEVGADGATITAEGVFGPVGGRGDDPANVPGELALRCPATG